MSEEPIIRIEEREVRSEESEAGSYQIADFRY
jgi:hypothetical protein